MANEVDTLDRVAPYLGVAPQGTRPWNNQPSPRACFLRMHPLSGVAWLRTKDVPSSIPTGWYRGVFRSEVSHPCTIHPMLRRFWARADPSRHATSCTMPVPSNTTCASLVSSEKQRIFETSLPFPTLPYHGVPLGGGEEETSPYGYGYPYGRSHVEVRSHRNRLESFVSRLLASTMAKDGGVDGEEDATRSSNEGGSIVDGRNGRVDQDRRGGEARDAEHSEGTQGRNVGDASSGEDQGRYSMRNQFEGLEILRSNRWSSRRNFDEDNDSDDEADSQADEKSESGRDDGFESRTRWQRFVHWLHSPLQQTKTAAKRMQQSEFALVAILLQQRMIVVTDKHVFTSYPSVRHWVNYNTAGAPSGFLAGESERGSSDIPRGSGISMVEVDEPDMDPGYHTRTESFMAQKVHRCCRTIPKLPLVTATLNPMSLLSFVWAFVMLFTILVYVAFLLPITLAFSDDLTLTSWLEWLDTSFGLLFVVDLYLKFRTGFIVRYRNRVKLVMDSRVVAKYYFFSFVFWVDFLSVLPFFLTIVATATDGAAVKNNAFQAFKLFRLLRMFQFLSIVSSGSIGLAEERASNFFGPTFLYFLHVLYTFAMVANFFACLFLYTAFDLEDLDDSWLTDVNGKDLTNSVPPRQYLAALYFAVTTITTVGYGDISAQTPVEEGICIFVQACGAVMFGYVTASLGVILSTQSDAAHKVQQYRDKVNFVSKWLEASKLPHRLKRKIKASFQHHFIFQEDQDLVGMTVEVFKELHSGLKAEVAETLLHPILVDLYPKLSEDIALWKLAGSCKPLPAPRGVELCKFGYPVDSIYFLRRGTVELLDEMDECIGQFGAPRAFGLLSSFYKGQTDEVTKKEQDIYLVTVRVLVTSDVWCIEKKVINHIWRLYPQLQEEMMLTLRSEIRGNPDLWRLSPDHPILTRIFDCDDEEDT